MNDTKRPSYATLELNWMGRPKSIAAVLVSSDGVHALIDPGPASTLGNLRGELAQRGLGLRDLGAVLLTHIHLDHAGAVGALVEENPKLAVFVHEFGAMHLADPAKLLASAGRLYGHEMEKLYGGMVPVPEENMRALEGGETVTIGKRDFSVLYTPGHASHHVTYWDGQDGTAFVGDTAGISVEGHEFILPATPPPDIDLALWNKSLDAIASLEPARLFLTHFGYALDPRAHIARYRNCLADWFRLVEQLMASGKTEEEAGREFVENFSGEMKRTLPESEADHYIFNGGLYLSWLGLVRHMKKKAAQSQTRA
jgi:glyoxylase-like metal-dependent hydrolase (beta-lactamase superfamily II)